MPWILSRKNGSPVPGVGLQHLQPCDIQYVTDKQAQAIARDPYSYAKTGCRAYQYSIHKDEAEPDLRAMLKPMYGTKYTLDSLQGKVYETISTRSCYIDEAFVLQKSVLTKEQLSDGRILPVLDMTTVDLKDTSIFKAGIPKIAVAKDLAAWTAGTKTWGGVGADYPTLSECANDRGAATGNCILDQAGITTETGSANYANLINGFDITTRCTASKHLGIATAGYLMSIDTNNARFIDVVNINGAGNLIFDGLNMKSVSVGNNQMVFLISGTMGAANLWLKNLIVDGDSDACAAFQFSGASNTAIYMQNCKIVKCAYIAIYPSSGVANGSIFENISITDCNYSIYIASGVSTFRNVASHGNTQTAFGGNVNTQTGASCAHGGAGAIGFGTETGTVSNLADTDYVSVDPANASFLIPTGTTLNAGAAPGITGHTTYINEVAMASPYWIGAHGIAAAGGVTRHMDYYRRRRAA